MNKTIFAAVMLATLLWVAPALLSMELLSDESVKCTYTHHDMWKGKTAGEGILFIGMYGGNEKVFIVWGKNRDDLVQRIGFSQKQVDKEKEPSSPPWYQEFTDMLKKAVEWEEASELNGLEDVKKPIALGWTYNKLKKGTVGRISKTWGGGGKYEVIEIRVSEISKLLNLFDGVPDMEGKVQEEAKKLKDESERKKAEEKDKKDKVDSLLK
ncbi:MAG: hypothetical protein WC637_06825 [Victivallales bacterium]|jgi:hypothetical protein